MPDLPKTTASLPVPCGRCGGDKSTTAVLSGRDALVMEVGRLYTELMSGDWRSQKWTDRAATFHGLQDAVSRALVALREFDAAHREGEKENG